MYTGILEYCLLAALFCFESLPDKLSMPNAEESALEDEIGFFYINAKISNPLAFLCPMAELLASEKVKAVILIFERSNNDTRRSFKLYAGLKAIKSSL